MEKKNIWIVVIVVVVMVVLCCCAILVASGAFAAIGATNFIQELETSQNNQESTPRDIIKMPTNTPVPGVEPGSVNPDPTQEQTMIDAAILAQMEKIEREVEGIRGLPTANDLVRKTLSQEQLRQHVMEDFFVDYTEEEVRQDALILNLFGLIDRDYDLYELFVELYSEQIAGFYDDETKEMVVVQGKGFAGPERMTYAHEYTHALQDAQYDLEDGLKLQDEFCELDSEYCGAVTALIEGDASFTETQWFLEHSTLKDKQEVLQYYQNYASPIFDTTPAFLQEDLIFPYVKGLEFVTYLFEKGGYAAIDDAYLNPPVSTEQILHPERYPNDQPIKIELKDFTSILGDGWEEIERNALGEWYSYLMFAKPLNSDWALVEDIALAAAEGWGGDLYLVYQHSTNDEVVLISVSQWDTQVDADEYWQAFTDYAALRWGNTTQNSTNQMVWELESETIMISRQTNQILWIITPNLDMAQKLAIEFPLFQ